MTENRLREPGSDMQQRAPGQDLNRAAAVRAKPLYMGRLLYPLNRAPNISLGQNNYSSDFQTHFKLTQNELYSYNDITLRRASFNLHFCALPADQYFVTCEVVIFSSNLITEKK